MTYARNRWRASSEETTEEQWVSALQLALDEVNGDGDGGGRGGEVDDGSPEPQDLPPPREEPGAGIKAARPRQESRAYAVELLPEPLVVGTFETRREAEPWDELLTAAFVWPPHTAADDAFRHLAFGARAWSRVDVPDVVFTELLRHRDMDPASWRTAIYHIVLKGSRPQVRPR